MERAEAVSETRVLRTLIGIESETKLFDATQPLKFNRIDQAEPSTGLQRLSSRKGMMLWTGSR